MLTQAQLDPFHRDGFLALRSLLRGAELDLLRQAADRVQADGIAGLGQHHFYHQTPGGYPVYCRSERLWDRDPIFLASTVHPLLLEAIGQCLGHPFLPVDDSFVCNSPFGNVPSHWHQDPPYSDPGRAKTFAIPDFATAIYLDSSTRENGCLWALPGHHLVGHVELEHCAEEELFDRAIPIEMAPGDVLFHSRSAPHGSRGNTSPWPRRIFCVHYMAEEVWTDGYSGWEGEKRGYGPQGRALARQMLETRRALGLKGLEGSQVRWTGDDFECTGQPITPPRHWGALIDGISPEEKRRKKTLED